MKFGILVPINGQRIGHSHERQLVMKYVMLILQRLCNEDAHMTPYRVSEEVENSS